MRTFNIFNQKEIDQRMIGNYKDFKFNKNYNSNYLIKREIPEFYNNINDYSVGVYYRVIVNIPDNLNKINNAREICKTILKSFFYLNPKMTNEQLYNIYNKYSKINYFPKNFDFYKNLYDHIDKIKRNECYTKITKVIVNEYKMSDKLNINIYSKEFNEKLKDWYRINARKVYSEWLVYEIGYYFYKNLNSFDLSIEKIMDVFEIKDRRTVINILKINRIEFNKNSITFIDQITNEKTFIKIKDIKDIIIEKNIKYFLTTNKKISIELLLNECKYLSGDEIKSISRSYLFEFLKNNIELKNKIDIHNKNINNDKIFIEKEVEYVNIQNNNTYRNSNGKIVKNEYNIDDMFDQYIK